MPFTAFLMIYDSSEESCLSTYLYVHNVLIFIIFVLQKMCEIHGSYLASIETAAENQYIKTILAVHRHSE